MYTDKENTMLDAVLVTASGVAGDVIRINNRQRIPMLGAYLQLQSALNNLTSLRLQLVSSALPDLSSPTVLLDTQVLTLAQWNALVTAGNARFKLNLVPEVAQTDNYLGIVATLVGTAPTTGLLTAGLSEIVTAENAARPAYFTGLT